MMYPDTNVLNVANYSICMRVRKAAILFLSLEDRIPLNAEVINNEE